MSRCTLCLNNSRGLRTNTKEGLTMKYRKNNETINKYLAGLFDGDGNVQVTMSHKQDKDKLYHSVGIRFLISLKNTERNNKLLLWLFDHYGFGNITIKPSYNRCEMVEWTAYGKEAVTLLKVFKKHSVIKGKHIDRSIYMFYRYKERPYSEEALKRYRKWSRDNTTSIKPKKHITWAWLAGYIDSDGSIEHEASRGRAIRFECHPRDHSAIDLIAKSFGRTDKIRTYETNTKGTICPVYHLILPMGLSDRSLGHKILPNLVPHLKLKRWEAEQILAYYNTNNSYSNPLAETK